MEREQILTRLRQILVEQFNEGELRDICFDLGIDHEILLGDGKGNIARELISYCERRGITSQLVKKIIQLRPNVSFVGKLKDTAITQVVFHQGLKGPKVQALVMFTFDESDKFSLSWIDLKPRDMDTIIQVARAIENRFLSGEAPIPDEVRLPEGLLNL